MMVAFAYSQTIIYNHHKKVFELFGKSLNPYLETVSILVWKLYRQVQKPSGADKEAINQSQAAASLVNTQMVGTHPPD